MKDVVKVETEVSRDKIEKYLDTFGIGTGLTNSEKEQFIEIAQAYSLNPFKREIYCVPFMVSKKLDNGKWAKERKLSIITGYEVYLKRAERTGKLNGWEVKTDGSISKGTLKAVVTIYRKDWEHPLNHEVWFKEYNQENRMWKGKPVTMIKKVAIAQAFRLAFPDELGGIPYTADELPDEMVRDVTPKKPVETEKLEEPISDLQADIAETTADIEKAQAQGWITKEVAESDFATVKNIQTKTGLDVFRKMLGRQVEEGEKKIKPEEKTKVDKEELF